MTNEELPRLTTLRPSNPDDRAELEAAVVTLRAQGGREAQLADRISAALRALDDRITDITVAYVREIADLQATRN